VTEVDLSNAAFPWLSARRIDVGAAECRALRVNFVGELGWELHHPIEMQNAIFDALMAAGAEFGISPFGIRAMDSLRLEKSYRVVGRELSIEYSALEAGLDRFVRLEKPGCAVLRGREAAWQFVTLRVLDVTDADARGSEPIYRDGALVGRCSSGGYGWRVGQSLALGYVRPAYAQVGTELEIVILGVAHRAVVIRDSPYDAGNERLHG